MMTGTRTCGDLVFLTWTPDNAAEGFGSNLHRGYEDIGRHLDETGSVPIQERVFCDLAITNEVAAARIAVLGDGPLTEVPPTFIEGSPTHGGQMAGIHVIAARPAGTDHAESIVDGSTVCGRRVTAKNASYLGLSDIGRLLKTAQNLTAGAETRETLLMTDSLLDAQGWSFSDVLRTWFYLDDILAWYDEFNSARNEVFTKLGLLNGSAPGLIPASTGIRGHNPRGRRCTLDLLAVQARPGKPIAVDMLHNPLQNEAPEYGSAFSRGLRLTAGDCNTLLVSGTASIDEDGSTVHPEDFESQTRRTLDNIESLLASRGATMGDICQATAFVKRRGDIGRLDSILRSRGLETVPMVFTVDDVCREDLLVEIDATAMVPVRVRDDD